MTKALSQTDKIIQQLQWLFRNSTYGKFTTKPTEYSEEDKQTLESIVRNLK